MFLTSPFCVLHDLIIKYLQRLINDRQPFVRLNKNLIDGYCKQCRGKWSTHPHDDYYYQYLLYHSIQARDEKTIQEIITDFKWMSIKIQLDKTIYNLTIDLEKAIDYLRIKEIKVDDTIR